VPHITPPPPVDAEAKLATSLAQVRRRQTHDLDLVEQFLTGGDVPDLENKFETSLLLRYGGLCQEFVNSKYSHNCTAEDGATYARRAAAELLTQERRPRHAAQQPLHATELLHAAELDDQQEAALRAEMEDEAAARGEKVDEEFLDIAISQSRLQQKRVACDFDETFDDEVAIAATERGLPHRRRTGSRPSQ